MIAIPNAEMPKGCVDCPVNDMVCELWTEVDNIKTHTHKDCPLIDIVRCKDCKYFISPYENLIDADGLCDNMQVVMDKTDYCSHGERRTDDHI